MTVKKILILGENSQLSKCLSNCKNKDYLFFFLNRKKLDITNFKKTNKIINQINPQIIINCIAFTDVDGAEKNKLLAKKTNYLGIKNIIKSIINSNILFVHFSTDYVYDGIKNLSYKEDDDTNPLSTYGKTKLSGDLFITKNYNFYLIFRISWLYSEYNNNFLLNFINLAKKNSKLTVISDNYGRPTNANNLSKFVFFAIKKTLNNKKLIGVYNYTDSGKKVSWYHLVNFIYTQMKIKGIKVPILNKTKQHLYNSRAIRPINSSLNLKKIHYKFKFMPNSWKNNILTEINKVL